MSAKIKRLLILLVFSLCMFGLSIHFVVEGLGGVHDHVVGRQATVTFHSHDGDQFVLAESGGDRFAQLELRVAFTSELDLVSQPLHPPFHPPKSF